MSPTVRRGFGHLAPPGQPSVQQPTEHAVAGTKRVVQGAQVAVAPDGTVYVAWLDTTDDDSFKGQAEIHVARSEDGGKTFVHLGPAATFRELPFRPRTAFFRYWGSNFPQLAVGPEGEVYLVYGALPPTIPGTMGTFTSSAPWTGEPPGAPPPPGGTTGAGPSSSRPSPWTPRGHPRDVGGYPP